MSKGRMARNKGKRGERMLATELREAFPEFADDIRRGWQTREGDDDPDVIVPFPVWFESKFLAKFNTKALDQAATDSKGRGVPVAVIRANNKKPVAMIRWEDFIPILQAYVRSRGHERRGQRRGAVQSGGDDVLREKRGRRDVPRSASRRWRIRLRRS